MKDRNKKIIRIAGLILYAISWILLAFPVAFLIPDFSRGLDRHLKSWSPALPWEWMYAYALPFLLVAIYFSIKRKGVPALLWLITSIGIVFSVFILTEVIIYAT